MLGTFDFECNECKNRFEFTILGNVESGAPYCPRCLSEEVTKLFSPPSAVGLGLEAVGITHENYFRPDKPPNPAKMWNKFAYNCEKKEGEGKIPKVDDHVDWAIKAWKDAGYET